MKKSEDKLIRFVWSRNVEYDYLLLLQVHAKNPYSFKKPKSIWEDIAKTLRKDHPIMKVTERSCRDRVKELLKKYRMEEGQIFRSTGATDDKIDKIKKLLIDINEMSLTKPQEIHSTMYLKNTRTDGERIRDEVLQELSDSDSDDYIHSRGNSGRKSVTNAPMTLEEEDALILQTMNALESQTIVVDDIDSDASDRQPARENETQVPALNQSWKDIPSGSRDFRHTIPLDNSDSQVSQLPLDNSDSQVSQLPLDNSDSQVSQLPLDNSDSQVSQLPLDNSDSQTNNTNDNSGHSRPAHKNLTQSLSTTCEDRRSISVEVADGQVRRNVRSDSSVSKMSPPRNTASNNRFSNPKKDLINYLGIKADNDMICRKEELRIREMEMGNKKEELEIMRLKVITESEERKRCQELEAQNKKEELQILRIKTENEAEERKKMQDLLITLLTQKNSN